MASVWPLTWKSNNPDPAATGGFRSLLDPDTGEVTASGAIFDAFSLAAEGRMAPLEISVPNQVQGLAMQAAGRDRLLVYLLNKTEQSLSVELNLARTPLTASYMTYTAGDPAYYGQAQEYPLEPSGPSLEITLPDTSFVFAQLDFDEGEALVPEPVTIERMQSDAYRISLESSQRGYLYELLGTEELGQEESWRSLQSRIPVFNELGEPLHFDADELGERSFYKIRKTAID